MRSTSTDSPVIQMAGITKAFPGVVANDDITLAVWPGTIHAIIGENGAGKSTLMGILFGRHQPDSGRIRILGEDVRIDSPARAIALGIGMVTQHTTMVPALTVLENIVLGAEPSRAGVINRAGARKRVSDLAETLGIEVDLDAVAGSLSVAALQKAEIVKALFRRASILILDEPTATLAPVEAEALFRLLHTLRDSGTTIIFITHKLREVMAHASRVTILRAGKCVGERRTDETDPDALLALMIGQRSAAPSILQELGATTVANGPAPAYLIGNEKPGSAGALPTLEVRELSVGGRRGALAVRGVSLDVMPGEVLGVAGVDGSGQRQLAEAIVGLRPVKSGSIRLDGKDVTARSVADRLSAGITYIPEDRHREGLVLDFSLSENLLLGRERDRRFGGGAVLDLGRIEDTGDDVVIRSRVKAPNAAVAARSLSGGNQQKVVIARALAGEPRILVAMQPTRGLDVEATRFVYEQLRAAQPNGLGIILFSLDLDEVFAISDRIAVMFDGSLMGIVPRAEATVDRIGQMMVGQGTAI